jgi:uncharacterized membrane protein
MKVDLKSDLSIRLIKFFLPFVIAGLIIFILYIVVEKDAAGKLFFLLFAYFFPPLGKETIIPIGVTGGELTIPILNRYIVVPSINPFLMAMTIAFVDIIVALFLVWNYDLAKKIPLIGKFIVKIENIGRNSSDKYNWIKPLRFIGIILFVMVPFQGSGGVVASILGRLFGMKPWNTFFAISIGAIIGCLVIAYSAETIKSVLVTNFMMGLLIIIILIIVGIMFLIYIRNKKNSIKENN